MMRSMRPGRRTLLLAAACGLVLPVRADTVALREAFAAGGAALLVRHALTDAGIGDPPGFRLDDCRSQRNLSAAGREQARRAGQALAALQLKVDEVRSSRWCRCIDTARLMFPGREVTVLEALNSFFEDRSSAARQTAALQSYLTQLAPRNAVLVTHQVNVSALTGVGVAMGEGVVVRMDNGSPRLLARAALA
jgi:broad specificity phosphatase PhoE